MVHYVQRELLLSSESRGRAPRSAQDCAAVLDRFSVVRTLLRNSITSNLVRGWGSESPLGLVSRFSASRRKKQVVSSTRVSVRQRVFLLLCVFLRSNFFPIKSLLMLLELKEFRMSLCHNGLSQNAVYAAHGSYYYTKRFIQVERTLLCNDDLDTL